MSSSIRMKWKKKGGWLRLVKIVWPNCNCVTAQTDCDIHCEQISNDL